MKEPIFTESAPRPVGPYSQAIKAGNWLYISGQIPLEPQMGTLITDNIEAATERVLQNISAILEAAGATLEHVVKTTIYLKDMENFPIVNAVYEKFFSSSPPARTTVEVSALPKGVPIEIDAIAYLKEG